MLRLGCTQVGWLRVKVLTLCWRLEAHEGVVPNHTPKNDAAQQQRRKRARPDDNVEQLCVVPRHFVYKVGCAAVLLL
jgi:hypothetical protein